MKLIRLFIREPRPRRDPVGLIEIFPVATERHRFTKFSKQMQFVLNDLRTGVFMEAGK